MSTAKRKLEAILGASRKLLSFPEFRATMMTVIIHRTNCVLID